MGDSLLDLIELNKKWQYFNNPEEMSSFIMRGERPLMILDRATITRLEMPIRINSKNRMCEIYLKVNNNNMIEFLQLYPMNKEEDKYNKKNTLFSIQLKSTNNKFAEKIKSSFPKDNIKRDILSSFNLNDLLKKEEYKDKITLHGNAKKVYNIDSSIGEWEKTETLKDLIRFLSNGLMDYRRDNGRLEQLLNRELGFYTIVFKQKNEEEQNKKRPLFVTFGLLDYRHVIDEGNHYLVFGALIAGGRNDVFNYNNINKFLNEEDLESNFKINPRLTVTALTKRFLESMRQDYFKKIGVEREDIIGKVRINEEYFLKVKYL